MSAVDVAALWFGRFWGCFFLGVVLYVVWLGVRARIEDTRTARTRAMTRHPVGRVRHDAYGWCGCDRCGSWDRELAAILEGGGA